MTSTAPHGAVSVTSQAVVLVNADAATLSPQQQNDIINAVVIGICGSSRRWAPSAALRPDTQPAMCHD